MAAAIAPTVEETEPLLHHDPAPAPLTEDDCGQSQPDRFLPIALLAAFAMSSTAATSFYAFATLMCSDPAHCKGNEQSRYAGTIAITTSIANIGGILALGHLQKWSERNNRVGLLIWMLTRSMSAVMLLVGVKTNKLLVALFSRLFEGLASDNLLHFVLNFIYVRSEDRERTSSLIGKSLALYLTGISISPYVAGLFGDFKISFVIAIGLFGVSIIYLQVAVPRTSSKRTGIAAGNDGDTKPSRPIKQVLVTMLTPLKALVHLPTAFVGSALLTHNAVQSYIFSALLVHTSLHFHFTGRENGVLVSVAHIVATAYILINLFVIPKLQWNTTKKHTLTTSVQERPRVVTRDTIAGLSSLALETASLAGIGCATRPILILASVALLSLSLPAPSFIKAAYLNRGEGHNKSEILASLTLMETLGSILGPIVLGGIQYLSTHDTLVFFAASVVAFTSAVLFYIGIAISSP